MRQIDIVLLDNFPSLSLAMITEPLRLANREKVTQCFRWRILGAAAQTVRSSSGLKIQCDATLDFQRADAVILLSSYEPEIGLTPILINWLKQRAQQGQLMGCVDTAALIFAAAGLLEKYPAAVHHEAIEGFKIEFPHTYFSDQLFTFNKSRCSSAGGVVTVDMTLALINHFESDELATRVTEILNYQPINSAQSLSKAGRSWDVPRVNRQLAHCVEIMIANIDTPISIQRLASMVGLKEWGIRRLFLRYLKQTPLTYYRNIRLSRAQDMLRNSHASIGGIASACGFENFETFSRVYKKHFGLQPSKDRNWPIQ